MAEAVAESVHINSLVLITGYQLSQLMVACYHGNMDYVEDLLQAPGVQVDLQNNNGQHALQCACEQGHTEIAQLLLNTCQSPTTIANLQDQDGLTPMMWASFYGHTEIVSLLLQYGAQVNVQDIEGWSSLMLASQNGHSETVLLLIQNGALQENEGFSSLMFASKNGHSETVLVLLRNSAHINPARVVTSDVCKY